MDTGQCPIINILFECQSGKFQPGETMRVENVEQICAGLIFINMESHRLSCAPPLMPLFVTNLTRPEKRKLEATTQNGLYGEKHRIYL